MSKKVLLSGVQPSGKPHIGNYFGAMKQFVDLSQDYESYIFIADYHAMHSLRNPKEMKENIIGMVLDYLAIGLDPKKVTIFKQSDISEHTELAWIFDTITTIPYLMLSHAFKSQVGKNYLDKFKDADELFNSLPKNDQGHVTYDSEMKRIFSGVNVGTFNYPMLMAADILLYSPDIIPVGQDQKQHVEYARDTAGRFNNTYGVTFKLPEPMILKHVAIVPGLDGRKMSKSYGNTIPLFAEHDEIKKCVMKIVTEGKYKEMKELLVEDLEKFIAPMRERRKELEKDIPKVLEILRDGGEKAKKIASAKMSEVREKVGVKLY